MSVIFSHPTGNANVRAAAKGLADAALLAEFHTTIAVFPGALLDRLGALRPLLELRRRRFDSSLRPHTTPWPWFEAGRLLASRAGFNQLTKHEQGIFSIDAVYRNLDKRVGDSIKYATQRGAQAVYAYEDGAVSSFRQAHKLGLQCFYDLPTGYWRAARRLLAGEKERWPAWASTMTGLNDSEEKLSIKDEELRLASRIFVASTFVANTLKEYPGALPPVDIIPYGFPTVGARREYPTRKEGQKIKLLFVGKLSQQKGIADLFAAVNALSKWVELTLVGHKGSDNCPALDAELAKHQWYPTLPHESVLQLMRAHDVLLFPSLFDGFGLVMTEAMSQGTPVITTDRSAGPDLIMNNQNGWLIEAASPSAIQNAIEHILTHPTLIAEAGSEAWDKARNRPWELYSEELSSAVRRHLNQ
ncbi:glycosyltransferase family 4 protein [Hymenobacter sp. BT186]|uniref:Glycosyltransferase family 4 protein n=1 Tax=Hymenobacter telluris TaxID=2816474 RepID=A0A939J892_9BACT|nr:glycosyltransferase family 4 protein [Hymenobacter telluris]MBO0357504.1 glycosyltransferase family 4 protein [Hymenobacter telluris]MBW3373530.1 glycosyltransferase family 4 protein [Hymenobacter norwichensis]